LQPGPGEITSQRLSYLRTPLVWEVVENLDKMAMHAAFTNDLFFGDCRIPEEEIDGINQYSISISASR
jgi:alkylation response protein AidB-like acyl-CoA dehydrogenase